MHASIILLNLSTEMTTQPTESMFSQVSKWVSKYLPLRRNRQPSPRASGTEQQPRREDDSKYGTNSPEHKAILSVTLQLVEYLQRNPDLIYPLQLRDHLFCQKSHFLQQSQSLASV